MKTIHYIYELIDPRTDETRYIGKAINPKKRLWGHLKESLYGTTHKCNWVKELSKLNLKPIINIIDNTEKDNINELEKFYISLYKSWGIKLTNITKGGDGGSIRLGYKNTKEHNKHISFGHTIEGKKLKEEKKKLTLQRKLEGNTKRLITPEARKKAVETRKKNYPSKQKKEKGPRKPLSETTKQRMSNSRIGKKHSPETLAKLKESNKRTGLLRKGKPSGRKGISNITASKPILQFTLQGEFIREFSSKVEASQILEIGGGAVRDNCLGRRKSRLNYILKYKEKN